MEAESKKSMQGNQTPLFPPRSTRRQEQKNLSEKVIKSMQHKHTHTHCILPLCGHRFLIVEVLTRSRLLPAYQQLNAEVERQVQRDLQHLQVETLAPSARWWNPEAPLARLRQKLCVSRISGPQLLSTIQRHHQYPSLLASQAAWLWCCVSTFLLSSTGVIITVLAGTMLPPKDHKCSLRLLK